MIYIFRVHFKPDRCFACHVTEVVALLINTSVDWGVHMECKLQWFLCVNISVKPLEESHNHPMPSSRFLPM